MAETENENPLLKALPPETDYISYLTILEYNLSVAQLPTLHDILQDITLTSNIGWDLVHLLVPLLPDSRQCLQDVARLGNPREVVLKVTELLEQFEQAAEDVSEQGETDPVDDHPVSGQVRDHGQCEEDLNRKADGVHPLDRKEEAVRDTKNGHPKPSSKVLQFTTMIEMLQILHPRIKTKYPSRFLSTSLQAIFQAYDSVSTSPEATEVVIAFLKAISGTTRPKLPPRISSTVAPPQATNEPESAPDPEANDGSIGSGEPAAQNRLLRGSLIYLAGVYVSNLPPVEDTSGIAWSSRLQEKVHPEKAIPGRRTYIDMFSLSDLHIRDTLIGQLAALARDLKLTVEDLLHGIYYPESNILADPAENDSPPPPQDNSISAAGYLYLLCSRIFSATILSAPLPLPPISVFPDFASILSNFIGLRSPATAGTEPPPLIDAVLFLGRYILSSTSTIGTPSDDEQFTSTLQLLALISANTPLPSLRYHAHTLCAKILHSHPSEHVRLAYIKDTLENCPYENLKASAVGWLKTELLSAVDQNNPSPSSTASSEEKVSLFGTPAALQTLAAHLFSPPSLPSDSEKNAEDQLIFFSNNHPFWMSVLNLVYFLSSSSSTQSWGMQQFIPDIQNFINGIDSLTETIQKITSGRNDTQDIERDTTLLTGVIGMVRGKLSALG